MLEPFHAIALYYFGNDAKLTIEFKAQEKERSPCRQLHTSLTAGYQPTIQATWK